jgi:hypothetical protein
MRDTRILALWETSCAKGKWLLRLFLKKGGKNIVLVDGAGYNSDRYGREADTT